MTDEKAPEVGHKTLLPDTALSDPQLDRLDRAPFAKSLSSCIRTLEGNDSFVIGLCGPWGSGKTSVLNFVLSGLESDKTDAPIVLRFNPWWFSGREQLLEAFLTQFTATLNMPKRGEKANQAGKLLETLSAALRPISLLPFVGEAAKAGKEAVDALASASKSYAEAVSQNVVAIRTEIDKILTDSPNRIIVVMDDIDRLAAKEISQLFLILKAVADFPRTVYLLAFDQQVVTQAINEQLGVDGKTYLEKIVQLQIDVPPTARTAIHQMFMEQLNELLRGEEMSPKQGQYFWNVFHDGLKHFLVTPRAAKKLINMLRFAYPPLRGEVNVVDMVGIACLTTFAPQVITTIATNADQFTGAGARSVMGGQDEYKQRQEFHKAWLNELPDREREAVKGIVKRLFPSVSHALGGAGYSNGFETTWQSDLRVCSPSHFEKYFRLAIQTGTISENEWKRIEERFEDSVALDELLAGYIGQIGPHGFRSRVSELLDRALVFARTAQPDQAATLFQSLLRTGDLMLAVSDVDTVGGMLEVDNSLRMKWVMLALLERFESQKRREDLIVASLKQDVGPHSASELVVLLGIQNGTYGKGKNSNDPGYAPLVAKSFVKRIAKKVREILRNETQRANGDQLAIHGDFMKIVVNWWRIGGTKEAKAWLMNATESDKMLVATLIQQLSKTRTHGMSDRTAIETEVIDSSFLKNFLPLKECRQRCEKLLRDSPEWLDKRGRSALTITVNSIKPNGKPIDHWAERIGKEPEKTKKRSKKASRNDMAESMNE